MSLKRALVGIFAFVLLRSMFVFAGDRKPITNADVVTMIEAGLAENTIVAAIMQGPPEFDTSPAALVELKKKGATPPMLEAMMQTSAPPPVSQARSTGNALLDAYYQSEGGYGNDVVLINGDDRVPMKYASMQQARGPIAPFAPVKLYNQLDGTSSVCRISGANTPVFEFSMDKNVQAGTRVALIRFAIRGNARAIQSMAVSGFTSRMTDGYPKERVVALEITEAETQGNASKSGQIRYIAKPLGNLLPGEYALVFDQYSAYDFGVDAP